MKSIRAMWAKNGDELSKQYAGTGSTSTEVTMNEKTSVKGKIVHKMTSIERFFKNNIKSGDDFRQVSIDLFTGQHKRSKSKSWHEVEESYNDEGSEKWHKEVLQSKTSAYTLCVFSWNLAGNEPRYEMDFVQVFKSDQFEKSPDIVIIGFQETMVLNAFNCLKGHDKNRVDSLKSYAVDALNDLDPDESYTFVTHSAMVGLLVLCFCKSPIINKITDVMVTKVKTGFGGNMGNKGGVLIRFDLDDTKICV
jgi:hypothetical protein